MSVIDARQVFEVECIAVNRAMIRRGVLMALGWGMVFAAHAAVLDDPDEKPWVEGAFELPAFPEPANLIPFEVGSRTGVKFAVDGKSISIGNDGVIRYTLVVVSSQGAQNISYEGMRCETGERRSYAFGRADGSWSKAKGDRWVKIFGDLNNHHVELFVNYLCAKAAAPIFTPEDARQVLRNGGARAAIKGG